ncbi:hypothetical protein HDE76_000268 [Rhodanobacter sp. ANJX3]|nr:MULTISPECIES: hypothetical protein [unclassified Rhodanobacter]MBB5357086.1 hypothetical protein [Rhodanobacter sp. ANJX3]NYE27157.1 hypothetical protein [Rhodanobacter sp. K2T2]
MRISFSAYRLGIANLGREEAYIRKLLPVLSDSGAFYTLLVGGLE